MRLTNSRLLAEHSTLPQKIVRWLVSALLVSAQLVAGLSYKLRLPACRTDPNHCLFVLDEPFFVFGFLFTSAAVWHLGDVVSQQPKARSLRIMGSYALFFVSLVSLIGSLWLLRATTTVNHYGHMEAPGAVSALLVSLVVFVPLVAIGKLLVSSILAIRDAVVRHQRA